MKDKQITYYKIFWLYLAGCIAGVIIEGIFCLVTKGNSLNNLKQNQKGNRRNENTFIRTFYI